ncbi:tyrosine-protein phosphatase non-receptor type 23-like [Antedon mediterranea]|uniref:tyrosine-protein phosphatase non-receptor type 23-like n=1 Tax=Antedon mediterranea TaxID=105859 RepID=UPI003AF7C099
MEAVPRMEMLFLELKQSSEKVEFSSVLKKYISEHYMEDASRYNDEIRQIEQLRSSASNVAQDFGGLSTLKKYYGQLHLLTSRFPMAEGEPSFIQFVWVDAFDETFVTEGDIHFEQASILYNLGTLHAILGARESRTSEEEMKVACTHFQCAAGVFSFLKDHVGSNKSPDISMELLQIYINLMLGQAQECLLEKSMQDNRKSSLVARISSQVKDFYKLALKGLDDSRADIIVGSRRYKQWKKVLQIKIAHFTSIAYMYMGNQAEEQQKYGDRVAYMKAALDKHSEAVKLAKGQKEGIAEALVFTKDVVVGKHEAAKKDNDFIYHDKIPDIESLPDIKGASLVKALTFQAYDETVAGPDIFKKLVPMEAHAAASVYSEEKAKLLRELGAKIEGKNNQLDQYLESLQVDQLRLQKEPERLPQVLLEVCAAISVKPDAIKSLVQSMNELSNVVLDVDAELKEVEAIVNQEKQDEESYSKEFSSKPEFVVKDIGKELKKYKEGHTKASQSNTDLHKAMEVHLANIRLLAGPLEKLQEILPSQKATESPEDQGVQDTLKMLIEKVEKMKNQRKHLEKQLREKLQNDDITSTIVTKDEGDRKKFFEEELAKHQSTVTYIEQNLSAQDNILKAVTEANARYADTRKMSADIAQRREDKIQELVMSYTVYDDLLAKSRKGIDFYKKLQIGIMKIHTNCTDLVKERQELRNRQIARFRPKPSPQRNPLPKQSEPGPAGPKLSDFWKPKTSQGLPASPVHAPSSTGMYPTAATIADVSAGGGALTGMPPMSSQGGVTNQRAHSQPGSMPPQQTPISQSHNTGPSAPPPSPARTGSMHQMPVSSQQQVPMSAGQPPTSMHPAPMHRPPVPVQHPHASTQQQIPSSMYSVPRSTQHVPMQQHQMHQPSTSIPQHVLSMPPPAASRPQQVASVPQAATSIPPHSVAMHPHTSAYQPAASAYQPAASIPPQVATFSQPAASMPPQVAAVPQPAASMPPQVAAVPQPAASMPPQVATVSQPAASMPQYSQQNYHHNQMITPSSQPMRTPNSTRQYNQPMHNTAYNPKLAMTSQAQMLNHNQHPSLQHHPSSQSAQLQNPNVPYQMHQQHQFSQQNMYQQPSQPSQSVQYQAQYMQQQVAQTRQQTPGQTTVAFPQPNQPGQQYYQNVGSPHGSPQHRPRAPQYNIPGSISQTPAQNSHQPYTQQNMQSYQPNQTPVGGYKQVSSQPQMYSQPPMPQQQVPPTSTHVYQQPTNIVQPNQGNFQQMQHKSQQSFQNHMTNPPLQQYSAQTSLQQPGNQPMPGRYTSQQPMAHPSQTSYQNQQPTQPGQSIAQPSQVVHQTPQPMTQPPQATHPSQPMAQSTQATQPGQPMAQSSLPVHQTQQPMVQPPQPTRPNPGAQYQTQQQPTQMQMPPNSQSGKPVPQPRQSLAKQPHSIQNIQQLEQQQLQQPLQPTKATGLKQPDLLSTSPDDNQQKSLENVLLPKKQEPKSVPEERPLRIVKMPSTDPYDDKENLDRFVEEVEKLEKYVEGLNKQTLSGPTVIDSLWRELVESQDRDTRQYSISIARCYSLKNRYPDFMPYDHNRVILKGLKDDYINASYLDDLTPSCPTIIATQSPTSMTILDFWTMIYENQVSVIAMLISKPPGKGKSDFITYWPEQRGQIMRHGPISVTLQATKTTDYHVERLMTISHRETRQMKTFAHLQFTAWPEFGVPTNSSSVLQFVGEVLNYQRQQRNTSLPIVVHCNGGVGRTGTFCTILAGVQEILAGSGIIDVPQVVKKQRQQRKWMVLEKEQLSFCFGTILCYAEQILTKRGIYLHPIIPTTSDKKKPPQRFTSFDPILGVDSIDNLQSKISQMNFMSSSSIATQATPTCQSTESSQTENQIISNGVTGTNLPDQDLLSQQNSKQLEDSVKPSETLTAIQPVSVESAVFVDSNGSDKTTVRVEAKPSTLNTLQERNLEDFGVSMVNFVPGESDDNNATQEVDEASNGNNHNNLLTDLNPQNFSLKNENTKQKISKADFFNQQSKLGHEVETDDPLSLLDPMWTMKGKPSTKSDSS